MKQRWLEVIFAGVVFSFAGLDGVAADRRIRAGFATADLTPPLGLEMGGFGMNLERKGEAVHDSLLARAVVLELDHRKVAIVGCDLGGIRAAIVATTRALIHDATGIEPQRVMIGATHTHSAPVAASWIGVGKEDPGYVSALPGKIAQAVIDANARLETVDLAYGEAAVDGVARNREYPGGPLDPKMRVLKVTLDGGKLAGFIANYSVHPVVMAEKTRLYTGDLTGVAANKITQAFPGSVGIFLQGSCGDINPIYAHMPQEESLEKLELLAGRLAGFIHGALDRSEAFRVGALDMITKMIDLPQVTAQKDLVLERKLSAERWLKDPGLPLDLRRDVQFRLDSAKAVLARFERPPLDQKIAEIQAARIGSVILLANPGETFQVFGKRAAEAFPKYHVLVAGYANDYVGYIPAPDRYDFDTLNTLSYPAYLTPWITGEFRYRQDVGDLLASEMVSLGKRLLKP